MAADSSSDISGCSAALVADLKSPASTSLAADDMPAMLVLSDLGLDEKKRFGGVSHAHVFGHCNGSVLVVAGDHQRTDSSPAGANHLG